MFNIRKLSILVMILFSATMNHASAPADEKEKAENLTSTSDGPGVKILSTKGDKFVKYVLSDPWEDGISYKYGDDDLLGFQNSLWESLKRLRLEFESTSDKQQQEKILGYYRHEYQAYKVTERLRQLEQRRESILKSIEGH